MSEKIPYAFDFPENVRFLLVSNPWDENSKEVELIMGFGFHDDKTCEATFHFKDDDIVAPESVDDLLGRLLELKGECSHKGFYDSSFKEVADTLAIIIDDYTDTRDKRIQKLREALSIALQWMPMTSDDPQTVNDIELVHKIVEETCPVKT